jgi:PBP1b-binding outer membrane lipoprotein LpoB
MKKLIALLLAGTLLLLGCAHQQNLTPEEKEAYHKSKMKYDAGQRGGP